MPLVEMEMIAAVAKNNVIGDSQQNRMLWHLPEDLTRFYKMTNGHLVIMGNKTYQSLPHGKLKNRINVVLTNHPPPPAAKDEEEEKDTQKDLYFVSFPMLWDVLTQHLDKKVFVIGGKAIYDLLFPYCSKLHLTEVDLEPAGDVLFPFSKDELAIACSYLEEAGPLSISATPEAIRYQYFTYHLQ